MLTHKKHKQFDRFLACKLHDGNTIQHPMNLILQTGEHIKPQVLITQHSHR